MSGEKAVKEKIWSSIGEVAANLDDLKPIVIQSLCMNCHEQGETRLLLTIIPFFREVIISSFQCDHCGYKSTSADPGGEIQPQAIVLTLKMTSRDDLNRQMVKSQYASVRFKEIDFEIPPKLGVLTTIEGLLDTAISELRDTVCQIDDELAANPDGFKTGSSWMDDMRRLKDKLEEFIPRLEAVKNGDSISIETPITMEIDDPSGNSFIENPSAPKSDHAMKVRKYDRSHEQNIMLGLAADIDDDDNNNNIIDENIPNESGRDETGILKPGSRISAEVVRDERVTIDKENLRIPADCPNCRAPGFSEMCITNIPFFKEIIIFAFTCEHCGFRNNEVKGGGAIPAKGKRFLLKVQKKKLHPEEFETDMNRDVVKSTSAGIYIPEIDLEVTSGSLGGMYTTVEGILDTINEKLFNSTLSEDVSHENFAHGDSADPKVKNRMDTFKDMFDSLMRGEMEYTFILDDPLDNSFLYSPTAPDPEPRLTIEEYQRSDEQDDEFGLKDMNVEGYDEHHIHDVLEENQMKPSENTDALKKMKDLQVFGKEAHPNRNVVARPEGFESEA